MKPLSGKRAFDLVISVPALLTTLPLQAVVAVAIWRAMGRPVLFRQTRPGLHGAPFQMNKFRTMAPVDVGSSLKDDGVRITTLGRILRETSIDELPTLWNVVRGDMSLVGPRPLLMQYLSRYTPEQNRRHEVKPGLTGLAQVSGRNAISWEDKFRLDVDYVNRRNFRLDLAILWATAFSVLRRDGISAAGEATMPEFLGTVREPSP